MSQAMAKSVPVASVLTALTIVPHSLGLSAGDPHGVCALTQHAAFLPSTPTANSEEAPLTTTYDPDPLAHEFEAALSPTETDKTRATFADRVRCRRLRPRHDVRLRPSDDVEAGRAGQRCRPVSRGTREACEAVRVGRGAGARSC